MTNVLARLRQAVLVGALAAWPVLASATTPVEPPHGSADHGAADGHGAAGDHGAADGHGAAGDHAAADEHAAGAHHACYSCDDNHDGVPNWRDSSAGSQFVLNSIGFHAINLLILIGVIWWGAGAALRDAVRGRALLIQRDLKDAAKVRAEAQARHEEVKARLAALEGEISELTARAKVEAAAEEARIVERAKETASRLEDTTRRQIQDEANRARQALRRQAVEIAVELAEGILKKQVQAGDQRRLAQELLDTVHAEGVNHG